MSVANLITARDNLDQLIATKTAEWIADGCPPTYSIDGESMDWNNWLTSKMTNLEQLDAAIARRSKFVVRSRGKP